MVGMPLQLAAIIKGPVTLFMWLPVAVFELTLGPWLLIKGVGAQVRLVTKET
jgi:hypothetical protein